MNVACSVKSSKYSLRKYVFQRTDFISKGAKIVCGLLFHRQQKKLHTYLHNWRREIRCRLLVLLRCWHLWNNSTAQSKLFKMKAKRFLVIAYKPLLTVNRIVSREKKSEAWRRWVLCAQVLRNQEQRKIQLKLLFQCWKLTTVASKNGKKQLRKGRLILGIRALQEHCNSANAYYERLQHLCRSEIVSGWCLRRALSAWKRSQQRRTLLLRALQRLANLTLAVFWIAWQQNIQTVPVENGQQLPLKESEQEDCAVPLPPMSPDPVFPEPVRESQLSRGKGKGEVVKTYRRAVYQDGDSAVVYKTFALVRRAKGSSQQPPHKKEEPSKSPRQNSTAKPVLLTLEERMRVRLASANALGAEFDRRYSARHSKHTGKKS